MQTVFTRWDVVGRRLALCLVGCAIGCGGVGCSDDTSADDTSADDTSADDEVPANSTTENADAGTKTLSAATSSQTTSGSSATRTDVTSESSDDSSTKAAEDAVDGSTTLSCASDDAAVAGETPDATTPVVRLSLEELRGLYRTWQTHTAEPQNISVQIFSLCRSPSAAEDAFVKSVHGDELYLFDWLNSAAQRGAAQWALGAQLVAPERPFTPLVDGGVAVFDAGAAIVKEKLVRTAEGYQLAALGLMVKREPGFARASGDWEFGYWTAADGMLSGAAETAGCAACHAGSATDFVFLDESWRLPSP